MPTSLPIVIQNVRLHRRFPAEIVAVDVSGRGFERMSTRRRSLLSGPAETQETTVKRRSRPRRPRGKRRNTIAGTDQKEIRQAIGGLVYLPILVLNPVTLNRRIPVNIFFRVGLFRRLFRVRDPYNEVNFLTSLSRLHY